MTLEETIRGLYRYHLDVHFPGEQFEPLPEFSVEKTARGELVIFAQRPGRERLVKALQLFVENTGLSVRVGGMVLSPVHSKLEGTTHPTNNGALLSIV